MRKIIEMDKYSSIWSRIIACIQGMGAYRRTIPQTGRDRKRFQKRNTLVQVIKRQRRGEVSRTRASVEKHKSTQYARKAKL